MNCVVDTQVSAACSGSQNSAGIDIRADTAGPVGGFIRDSRHAKRIFEGSHVKFMPEMEWFTKALQAPGALGAMRAKRSEEMCQLLLESSRLSIGLSIFSS